MRLSEVGVKHGIAAVLAVLTACGQSETGAPAVRRPTQANVANPSEKPTKEAVEKQSTETALAKSEPSSSGKPTAEEPPTAAGSNALAVMSTFRDRMCACADFACAQTVAAEVDAWTNADHSSMPPPSDEEIKKAGSVGQDLGMCLEDLRLKEAKSMPDSLSREMISSAVSAIRPLLADCGVRIPVKGRVKLGVLVNPDGKVLRVSVDGTPDEKLGNCVAAAMRTATFGKTKNGGRFVYPFVF